MSGGRALAARPRAPDVSRQAVAEPAEVARGTPAWPAAGLRPAYLPRLDDAPDLAGAMAEPRAAFGDLAAPAARATRIAPPTPDMDVGTAAPGAAKGEAAPSSADAAAEAAAAPGEAVGEAAGGGTHAAGPRPGKLVELRFVHDRKVPATGSAAVPRPPVRVVADTPAFSAPRTLGFGGVAQPGQTVPPTPEQRDCRALFQAAAEASAQFHQQLSDAAQRVAADAAALGRRLADRHQAALDDDVRRLGRDLDAARATLAAGREDALATLHDEADRLRMGIGGAAGAALGRLARLAADYDKAMRAPREASAGIKTRAATALGDLAVNGADAVDSIDALFDDPSAAHADDDDVWTPPANEALDDYLPPKALAEVERYDALVAGFTTPLARLVDCLPCKFEMAFGTMDARVRAVTDLGPRAVAAARDAALGQVAATELQLEDMIERGSAGTDDMLVDQHDGARRQYIDGARAGAESEAQRIDAAARGHVQTLTALAISQPVALQRVVDRLGEERSRPDAEFARVAVNAARRLRASLASSAARQPIAARLAAAQAFAASDAQARRFDEGIVRGVASIRRGGEEMVGNSLGSFADATARGASDMQPLAGSVTKACAAYLDPADHAFPEAVADLAEAVAGAGAEVDALLDGKPIAGGGGDVVQPDEPLVCTMDDASDRMSFMTPEPIMSSMAAPPPRARRPSAKPARKTGGGGPPAPLPASCFRCEDATKAQAPASTLAPPGPAPIIGTNPSQPSSAPPGERMTVKRLIAQAGNIALDPLADPAIDAFQKRAIKSVRGDLTKHSSAVRGQLGRFTPDGDAVVRELHGTTAVQGSAYRKDQPAEGGLDARIRRKLRLGWSAPSTKQARINAAINALNGLGGEAAFQELTVAFNFSDDNAQAQATLESLSAAELKDLQKNHGDELIAMAKALSGADRAKFEALIGLTDTPGAWRTAAQAAADYNALLMQEGVAKGRGVEGEKGWMQAGEALGGAGARATASRLSGNDDRFGLGDADAREAADKRQWEDTQIAYGRLQGKVPLPQDGRPLSEEERKGQVRLAQDAMIAQATETKTFHHSIPADDNGYGGAEWDTTDTVGDLHTTWIERVVRDGPGAKRTRAARLAIAAETGGGKPSRDDLIAAMHFDSADAIDNGHYDAGRRKEGEAQAQADQDDVLLIYAQDRLDRANAARGVSEENRQTAAEVRAELKAQIGARFGDDDKGRRDAVGIVDSPKGDALAAVELAIVREKKDIAIQQLKRMDAHEIDRLIADYAKAHPGEKGLEAQLGINGNRWTWRNWNGATFSGDDANEIEIAFKGVPQNDVERGEVALLVMNQQIDHAGWLGKRLAGGEFAALEANAAALREAMGVGDREIDARGRVVSIDPVTGERIPWGNFDASGDFVPSGPGSASAFERAVVMSRITADNYTSAVDAVANFVATALVVVAAVVTTALTGGAAASIWIPVLVTAAAGLVGVGLNIAIKGGRYGRDDMVRDLVATVVMAATAGIGAAAGAALRGGTPALKALSGSLRMSEQALAKAAGRTTALRALTLGEEMLIGAGTSGLASGANAAFDPAARRGDDYWGNLFHSIGRGAIGGGLGSLGARGGAKGFDALARRLGPTGSQRMLAAAIASGSKSELEAARRLMTAGGASWGRDMAARGFASGASGALSRGGELLYDREARGRDIGFGRILEEMGTAGLQNFIQGVGEGAADRGMRRRSAGREAEQQWVEAQHRLAAESAHTQPRPSPEAEAPARAAPAEPDDTASPAPGPAAAPPPEATPARAARADPEPRRATVPQQAEEREPAIHAIGGESEADGTRTITAANDNGPNYARIVLADVDMKTIGRIPEGSVFAHSDPYDRQAANDNFGRMMLHDPTREVAVFYNPITGEHIVIQGREKKVSIINAQGELSGAEAKSRWQSVLDQKGRGHWVMLTHYHPNRPGEAAAHISIRLPSGAFADMHVLANEVRTTGGGKRSSRIYFVDDGKLHFTDFTIDPKAEGGPYLIDYPAVGTGERKRERFTSMAEYHRFVERTAGIAYPVPAAFREPDLGAGPRAPRALESGSAVQRLHGDDIAQVLMAGRRLAAGDTGYAHAMVRDLGLVDEPNAMARLRLVLNEPKLPFETRKAVAAAVLEATRDEMRRTGRLAEGEEVHLLFHGAPQERADQLKAGGIDPAKLAHGPQEDFGGGLYLSRQLENALTYTRRLPASKRGGASPLPPDEAVLSGSGEIFPFIVRDSDLGARVNVEPGGQHRADWETFVMRNLNLYDEVVPIGQARFDPVTRTIAFGAMQAFANRGIAFERFLASLPAPYDRPDIVFGELGKLFTSGFGTGDQQTVKSTRLAALMSEQIAFRLPPAPAGDEAETVLARPRGDAPEPEAHSIDAPVRPHPAAEEGGAPDTAPPDAWAAEFARFQAALQPADLDGPRALIERIRDGQRAPPGSDRAQDAAEAQRRLDEQSLAPDATVINIDKAFLEGELARSKGRRRQRVEVTLEDGTVLTIWRTYTRKNPDPPIKFDAVLPKTPTGGRPVVYQFGDGALRVWRNKAGYIQQESLAGLGQRRLGYEGRFFSHGEGGFVGKITERAHAHGAGLGFESPFAIGLAPREVNQILQNEGIEQFMRDLRDILPPGAALLYSTIVEMVPMTLRQGKISYRIDIAMGGERFEFARFAINIETDPPGTPRKDRKGTRGIFVDEVEWSKPDDAAAARYFDHLREAVRIPAEMDHGPARVDAPRRGALIRSLYGRTSDEIERLAQVEEAGFLAARPPPRGRFDATTWQDDLRQRMRAAGKGWVVVDTRGLGLTARQLAALDRAIEALPARHRRRILRLR